MNWQASLMWPSNEDLLRWCQRFVSIIICVKFSNIKDGHPAIPMPDYVDETIKAVLRFEPTSVVVADLNKNGQAELVRDERSPQGYFVLDEKIDMERFQALGVVEQTARHTMNEGDGFFERPEGLFACEDFTKAQVVDAIREFIPNFKHEEKGKYLDQKM